MEIKIPLTLARYGGLRGQSIVIVGWKQYRPDELTGMCFRFVTRKNQRGLYLPAMQELQDFLAGLSRSSTLIAVRDDGTPWPSEKEMQARVSHYLRDLERAGLIGAGTTLHGLRVSYAAWWKRTGGANTRRWPTCWVTSRSAWASTTPGTSRRRRTSSGPSLGEGRKVNRFCTVLETGSADLENIRCPGAKTL
jgi:hypothetical protein